MPAPTATSRTKSETSATRTVKRHYSRERGVVIRGGIAVPPARGTACGWAALGVGRRRPLVRGGGGGDGVGIGARLGRARVPRVLPRRRSALRAAARDRVAAAVGTAVGRRRGARLGGAVDRHRGGDADARFVRRDLGAARAVACRCNRARGG